MKNFPVVILCGGKGTRMGNITQRIPKPMLKVNGIPLIQHIMNYYHLWGKSTFYLALGYKGDIIREWVSETNLPYTVICVDTGIDTQTGGRVKRMAEIVNYPFYMTYGDGLGDINLHALTMKYETRNCLGVISAVHPRSRFGTLECDWDRVTNFSEKDVSDSWINGGFFVLHPDIQKYIRGDEDNFEKDTLPKITEKGKLYAHFHSGEWLCADTVRDLEYMQKSKLFANKELNT